MHKRLQINDVSAAVTMGAVK